MAARYLLECTCGERLTVEPGQAGSQLTCPCGATLDVPTLRGLQSLPRAETAAEKSTAAWTLKQAIVTAGILVAVALFGMGLWIWRQERAIHRQRADLEFDAQDIATRIAVIDEDLEKISPLEIWRYWEYQLKPSTRQGFVDERAIDKQVTDVMVRWKRTERWVWWGAAAAVLAGALAWAALAPRRPIAG